MRAGTHSFSTPSSPLSCSLFLSLSSEETHDGGWICDRTGCTLEDTAAATDNTLIRGRELNAGDTRNREPMNLLND